jgi:hypothetical protein
MSSYVLQMLNRPKIGLTVNPIISTPLAHNWAGFVYYQSFFWAFTRQRRFLASLSARNGLSPFTLIGSQH